MGMWRDLLLSVPVAFCFFLLLAGGIYWLAGRIAPRSPDTPSKRQPYASGEELIPQETQLTYRAFFRLAFLFALLHVATLMVSTVPPTLTARRPAVIYLLAISISVFALFSVGDN